MNKFKERIHLVLTMMSILMLTPYHRLMAQDEYDDQITRLCHEKGTCLEDLSDNAIQLGMDSASIVGRIQNEFNLKFSERSEFGELVELLEDAINDCHTEKINLVVKDDGTVEISDEDRESGRLSLAYTVLGQAAWSLPNGAKKNAVRYFIREKAQANEVLGDLLSEDEIENVITGIIADEFPNDFTETTVVDLTKSSYKAFADKIVDKIISDAGVKEGINDMKKEVLGDFYKCIDSSVAEKNINECMEKFTKSAPYRVGKELLPKLIEMNFSTSLPDPSRLPYLKEKSMQSYKRCISTWYLKEERDTQAVQACIYEGLLKGYDIVSRDTLNDTLGSMVPDPSQRRKMINQILNDYQCSKGGLFKKTGRMLDRDYKRLSGISAQDFSNTLQNECVPNLKDKAGEIIVAHTLRTTSAVASSFERDDEGLELFVSRIIDENYRPCIATQRARGNDYIDPIACESIVKRGAALEVVAMQVRGTVADTLGGFGRGQSEAVEGPTETDRIAGNSTVEMRKCADKIKDDLLTAISENKGDDTWERKLVGCFANGIGMVAEELAAHTLVNELDVNPSLSPYDIDLESTGINKLAKQTAYNCYKSEIAKLENVDALGASLDSIGEKCATDVKKAVLPSLLEQVVAQILEEKVDGSEKEGLLSLIMGASPDSSNWREKFKTASNEEELNQMLDEFQGDAAWEIYRHLVGDTIDDKFPGDPKTQNRLKEQYLSLTVQRELKGMKGAQRDAYLEELQVFIAEDIGEQLVEDQLQSVLTSPGSQGRAREKIYETIHNCFKQEGKTAGELIDECGLIILGKATEVLGKEALSETIFKYVPSEKKRKELENFVKQDLDNCLDGLDSELNADDFDKQSQGCLGSTINNALDDILLAQLELNKDLLDESRGVSGYLGEVRSCLGKSPTSITTTSKIKSDFSRGKINISSMMEKISSCTDALLKGITGDAREGFIAPQFAHDRTELKPIKTEAIDLLLSLGGKDEGNPSHESMATILNMFEDKFISACNYDEGLCQTAVRADRFGIDKYMQENPDATKSEVMDRFYNGETMGLLVRSEVVATVKTSLEEALVDFRDERGILDGAIERMTSPEVMEKIFDTEKGKEIIQIAVEKIKAGKADELGDDEDFKAKVMAALTEDVSDDSFVDIFFYGVTQPKLKEEAEDPAFTTRIGRLLGMIRFSNFDWNKIRTTEAGKEARLYFRNHILRPMMAGVELPEEEQERRFKKCQKMLTDGIIELTPDPPKRPHHRPGGHGGKLKR